METPDTERLPLDKGHDLRANEDLNNLFLCGYCSAGPAKRSSDGVG